MDTNNPSPASIQTAQTVEPPTPQTVTPPQSNTNVVTQEKLKFIMPDFG